MKQALCFLLCLMVLLSLFGCAAPAREPEPTETAAPATEAQTPEPTEPEPTESEPTEAPEPAAEAPTEDCSGTVYTDYSRYTPGGLPEAKYTRLKAERIDRLEPGSYGTIFPFAGEEMIEQDYGYSFGYLYGFVDSKGTIVCDPVYSEVNRLSYYDEYTEETTWLPMWMLRYDDFPDGIVPDENSSWMDAKHNVAVAALDGSWVTRAKFSNVIGTPVGFIGYYDGKEPSFDVFDLHANRLFGSTELHDRLGDLKECIISWSDGLYLVDVYDGEAWGVYGIDTEGNLLFGPFRGVWGFSNGLAVATIDGELYGYIDRQGNWAIYPQYTEANNFHDSIASCCDGENALLTDRSGNPVLSRPGNRPFFYAGGGYYYSTESGERQFYDGEGNEVATSEGNDNYTWKQVEGSVFSYTPSDGPALLMDFATGQTLELPGGSGAFIPLRYFAFDGPGCIMEGYYFAGQPCYVTHIWHKETKSTSYRILSRDFETLEEFEGELQTFYDEMSSAVYLGFGSYEDDFWEIYRHDGTSMGKYCGVIRLYDGWLQVIEAFATSLYDPDGNLVFCYPRLNTLGE